MYGLCGANKSFSILILKQVQWRGPPGVRDIRKKEIITVHKSQLDW